MTWATVTERKMNRLVGWTVVVTEAVVVVVVVVEPNIPDSKCRHIVAVGRRRNSPVWDRACGDVAVAVVAVVEKKAMVVSRGCLDEQTVAAAAGS